MQKSGIVEVLRRCDSEDWTVRMKAVSELYAFGPLAAPYIALSMDDPHEWVRLRAVTTLGKFGDEVTDERACAQRERENGGSGEC